MSDHHSGRPGPMTWDMLLEDGVERVLLRVVFPPEIRPAYREAILAAILATQTPDPSARDCKRVPV